jgi:hypothetical protein
MKQENLPQFNFNKKWSDYFSNMTKEQFESLYVTCKKVLPMIKSKYPTKIEWNSPFDWLYLEAMDSAWYDQFAQNYENDIMDFKGLTNEQREFIVSQKEKQMLPGMWRELLNNPEYLPYNLTQKFPGDQLLNNHDREILDKGDYIQNLIKLSDLENKNTRFLIPNFPTTFYYHAFIEELKRRRRFQPIQLKKTEGRLLDNLRDPPWLPTDIFYKDREFKSRDDLVKTLRVYKSFGYSLIIEKSELKKGRFKLLWDRESKSKRQITTGDRIGAECNRCNAYVNMKTLCLLISKILEILL